MAREVPDPSSPELPGSVPDFADNRADPSTDVEAQVKDDSLRQAGSACVAEGNLQPKEGDPPPLLPVPGPGQHDADAVGLTDSLMTTVLVPKIKEDLLRATSLHFTLRGFGWCWRLCAGGGITTQVSAEAAAWIHSQSHVTRKINAFLSHSWRTGARSKYFTLLWLFGWPSAAVGFCIGLLLASALSLGGWAPQGNYLVVAKGWEGDIYMAWGIFPLLSQFFALVFLFMSPYLPKLLSKERQVFLDCVCIDQLDYERKMEGIASLAGFLYHSDELWILWTPAYFTRLWCVYELATYTSICSERPVHILFMFQYVGALFISLWTSFMLVALWVAASSGVMPGFVGVLVGVSTAGVLLIATALLDRACARCAAEVDRQLARFDCMSAECWSQDDRAFILQSIEQQHGSCARFNEKVNRRLRQQIATMVKSTWFTYRVAMCIASGTVGWAIEYIVAVLKSEAPPQIKLSACLVYVAMPFAAFPLVGKWSTFLASFYVEDKMNYREVGKSIVLSVMACISGAVALGGSTLWRRGLVPAAVYAALTIPSALWAFSPGRATCKRAA